jgi:hypothetical protein
LKRWGPFLLKTDKDLRIRIYGDAAVVTGLWGMALTKGDQAVGGGQARYIVVYVKRNATWQIVAEQRTFVP